MHEHQCNDGIVLKTEEWRDICGYEGRYQVSDQGRVRSLARHRRGKNNSLIFMPERMMRVSIKKDNGRTRPYAEIRFRDGAPRTERCKAFLVHRLVANAFIKRLEQGEQVDHKNGVHADNRVENLRVLTWQDHAMIHPKALAPNPRDPITGRWNCG